jgi:hypothetical protein
VSDMDNERNLSAPRSQQHAHVHPFRGACLPRQLYQTSRGVAAESTKSCDHKETEADVKATPHPLRVLLELGLLNTA